MLRAVIVSGSTLAGLVAVLAANPDDPVWSAGIATVASDSASTASADPSTGATTDSSSGSSSGSAGEASSSPTDSSSSPSRSSTTATGGFTGQAVSAGRFGLVQVTVTVENGRITDVAVPTVPDGDHRSAEISGYAVPVLVEQALSVQSAVIDGVSGATFTSAAFADSLASALQEAGL